MKDSVCVCDSVRGSEYVGATEIESKKVNEGV